MINYGYRILLSINTLVAVQISSQEIAKLLNIKKPQNRRCGTEALLLLGGDDEVVGTVYNGSVKGGEEDWGGCFAIVAHTSANDGEGYTFGYGGRCQ